MAQPTPTSTLASPSHSTLHNAYHNVKSYGAEGDNVTDDGPSIQAAIDAAGVEGGSGHVFFPAGSYAIYDTLTLDNEGVKLSGTVATESGEQGLPGSHITCSIGAPMFERTIPDVQVPVVFEDLGLRNYHAAGTCISLVGLTTSSSGIYRCNLKTAFDGIVLGSNAGVTVAYSSVIGTGSVGTGISTGNLILFCDVTHFETGLYGNGNTSIVGGRYEVNVVGILLGSGFRGTVTGMHFEANDIAIQVNGSGAGLVGGLDIHGSANAPSGQSLVGIDVGQCGQYTFQSIAEIGSHSTAFVRVKNNTRDCLSFIDVGSATAWSFLGDKTGISIMNCAPENDIVRAPVIATASLPAAGAAEDGRMIVEDAGAGNRNLIVYGGGQRFRIDGGAAV